MRNPAPLLLTIADLPRYARPDRRLELLDGHLFVSALETPYLVTIIERAAAVLRDAGAVSGGRRVLVNEPLIVDERNVLIPDVTVVAEGAPQLVVEVRSDSTTRYALGPKRMVYARAGISEYWYVDPGAASVSVLRRTQDQLDFGWPPDVRTNSETLVTRVVGREIRARDLLM